MRRSVRAELSGDRPTISFEFGPPRTPDAAFALWKTIDDLAALAPNFVSVT
ncbi:MAG: methylenetetrahydrofolate reductase, partial [Frankiaceae bacterium]|nr:methylenetetrahydrofolate reductase [Frankiaceae bacterium]